MERITPIIKLKTSIPKSSLCDHSDAYILDGGTVTIKEQEQIMLQNGQMKEKKK